MTSSTGSAAPFSSKVTARSIDERYARMPVCTSVTRSPCTARVTPAKTALAIQLGSGIAPGRRARRVALTTS